MFQLNIRIYYFLVGQKYQNRALITINNQVPIIKQDSINGELLEYLKVHMSITRFCFFPQNLMHIFFPLHL